MPVLARLHIYKRLANIAAFIFLPILGYFQAFALASPFSGKAHWMVQIAALAAFFLVLDGSKTLKAAVARSWWFATCWLASIFWWLFISMHVYGGLHSVLSILAIAALASALALYYALAGAIYWKFRVRGYLGSALMFAALWTLAELARGVFFTGFPWGAIGYTQIDGPLAWLARYVGVYGIGYAAAFLSVLVAFSAISIIAFIFGRLLSVARLPLSSMRVASAFMWLGAAALILHFGHSWQSKQFALEDAQLQTHGNAPISLALLQGNIPQDEKFVPGEGIEMSLRWYGEQFRTQKAELVIAPETAIPLLKKDLMPGYWEYVTESFHNGQQALLTGIPLGSFAQGYTNSVEGVKANENYTYNKSHLVPFGEFIPKGFHWFTEMMNIPLGDFNRGELNQPSFEWRGERFAPNICYEDLFGEELAKRFLDPQTAPTVFVNFSNIGWFGDGVATHQHLNISRMRTLELERPMVRATNTGATAVIDHRATVLAIAPYAQRMVLNATVQGIGQHGDKLTPYAQWASRYGLWPMWLACLFIVIAAGLCFKRVPTH